MTLRRLILAAGLLLPAAAHAQSHTTLTMGMAQFPPDMHPYITATSIKDTILFAVNRPMTAYAADASVICELCTEVPSLANGLAKVVKRPDGTEGMTVTYHLKPDLFWADGVPVTAKDVVFSYQVSRMFGPSPTIESATAVDDHTVTFTLRTTQYDYARIANSFAGSALLSEHIEAPIVAEAKTPLEYGEKSNFNRHPENPGLWLGPYKVAEFHPNDQVVLVPNPYWHGRKPGFQKIVMRLVENTAALQANLLSGDVDTVASGNLGLTLDQILSLAKTQSDKFDFDFIPSVNSYEHLTVNLDNPLLADKRVRQALSMAIDRKTIVGRLFANRFTPALGFKHPSQFGYDASVKTWPYDPAAAKALLAAAGFKPGADGILLSPGGQRFSIDLVSTAGNRTRELIEQVLQTEMKAIGVDVVIKNQPARVMFGDTLRHRSFTGLVEFQSDMPSDYVPMIYFSSTYIPTAENNWSGLNYMDFQSDAMDKAITAARAELDADKRRALWKPIQEIYGDELPEIPLYFPATGIITPKWMTGIVNPKRYGFITAWVEDWRPR
jgi:peptide/nickel transport system substrate-binding protein